MAPDDFHDFFVASAGVAGALIGLLFVAISVAPERLLSNDTDQIHRVRADAALTAFMNALSISLFALMPFKTLGWTAAIVSVIGLIFVFGSLTSLARAQMKGQRSAADRGFLILLGAAFVLQLVVGIGLMGNGDEENRVGWLAVVVFVCFVVGIQRAWELIGGPSISLRRELAALRREVQRRGHGDDDPDKEPPA